MLLCVGSVKWIHCGIIIGPYLDEHRRPTTTHTALQLADYANRGYYKFSRLDILPTSDEATTGGLDILPASDYPQLGRFERAFRLQLPEQGNSYELVKWQF